jgi:hypothetical protein
MSGISLQTAAQIFITFLPADSPLREANRLSLAGTSEDGKEVFVWAYTGQGVDTSRWERFYSHESRWVYSIDIEKLRLERVQAAVIDSVESGRTQPGWESNWMSFADNLLFLDRSTGKLLRMHDGTRAAPSLEGPTAVVLDRWQNHCIETAQSAMMPYCMWTVGVLHEQLREEMPDSKELSGVYALKLWEALVFYSVSPIYLRWIAEDLLQTLIEFGRLPAGIRFADTSPNDER